MIGIVVVVLFLLGLPLALLDLVDEHLGAGSVLSFFRLVARGHVTVSGFALRPTPRIAAAELSDAAGTRLAGCGAVVVEATLLAALRSLAAHALAGLLLWRRGGAGSVDLQQIAVELDDSSGEAMLDPLELEVLRDSVELLLSELPGGVD